MRPLLQNLRNTVEDAAEAGVVGNGRLRVGAAAALSLNAVKDLFGGFLDSHSGIDVAVEEADRSELLVKLSHRQVDAIIALGEHDDEFVDNLLLAQEEVYVAVASDHAWAKREKLTWDELRKATFLLSSQNRDVEVYDYVSKRLDGSDSLMHRKRHNVETDGIMALIGVGAGVGLVLAGVSNPNVILIPFGDERETVSLSVLWRPENDNPALRRFISLARIHAKKNEISA